MQNISEPKFFVGVVLLLFLGMVGLPGVFAENPLENLGQAIVEKYEETSKPLFETEEPPVKEKLKDDPFFDKIRKKHAKFTEEERSRRRAFRKKIRV